MTRTSLYHASKHADIELHSALMNQCMTFEKEIKNENKYFSYTHHFATEDIDSSIAIIWIIVILHGF